MFQVELKSERNLTVVKGTHEDGKGHANVEILEVCNELELTRIPQGIERFFPNLKALAWTNGNIKAISANDFKLFPNLTQVNLYNNRLTTLEGNLFEYNPNVTFVGFSFNSIAHVGHNLLSNLTKLKRSYFLFNVCINMYSYDKNSLSKLKRELKHKCSLPGVEKPYLM